MKDYRHQQTWRDPWDRPSLDRVVRPDKPKRNVARRDLLIPSGPPTAKLLGLTFVGGIGMTVLYVLAPAMAILIVTPVKVPAQWFWVGVGVTAITLWLALFVLAIWEEASDRRYAQRL
jgi:hypothetical protein